MDTQVAGKLVLFWSSTFLANEFCFFGSSCSCLFSPLSTVCIMIRLCFLMSHVRISTLTRVNRYGATGVTVCCLLGGMNRFHMLLPFVLLLRLLRSTCLIDLEIALHASLQGFYHMLAHLDDMNM
ncbi:hypothetical protein MAP00_006386 [Monascus purpureus]|nr:hypothetical protein MAP00_006386 [Monascus purpureus]